MYRCSSLLCFSLVALCGCAAHVHSDPGLNEPNSRTREQAVQILIHDGYRDITDLHRNGEDWIGTATKHGKRANVDIDKTGNINLVTAQQ